MSVSENKAASFDRQGQFHWSASPDVPLGSTDIEVRVTLSTVNPIDVKRRQGYGRRVFQIKGADPNHLALGNDFVGTVMRVGTRVVDFKPGDRVFGVMPPGKYGPHALRVVVSQSQAWKADPQLSDEQWVTLPYNTCTVLRAFDGIGLNAESAKGKHILVAGAAGGLGGIALGFLHQWGAQTTAIAHADAHAQCLADGAHAACAASELPNLQRKFDAALNFAAWDLDAALCRTLHPGALGYATTVHPLLTLLDQKGLLWGAISALRQRGEARKNVPRGARYVWALFALKAGDLALIQDFALRTRREPRIGIRAPLHEAPKAFAHVQQACAGRALLVCNEQGN